MYNRDLSLNHYHLPFTAKVCGPLCERCLSSDDARIESRHSWARASLAHRRQKLSQCVPVSAETVMRTHSILNSIASNRDKTMSVSSFPLEPTKKGSVLVILLLLQKSTTAKATYRRRSIFGFWSLS